MGNDFPVTYTSVSERCERCNCTGGDVAMKHHWPIKLISRVTRLPGGFLALCLIACEHAGFAGLGRPLPAHLLPATPPSADARPSLPRPAPPPSRAPPASLLGGRVARI